MSDTGDINNGAQPEDGTVVAEAPPEASAEERVASLTKQLATAEKERDEVNDRLLRALAETENVRKRANRQITEERAYAVEKFARDLLNVSDSLSRAIDSLPERERSLLHEAGRNAFDGIELTQKELVTVLSRHGVTPVNAQPGAGFDPAMHQAVTQIPSPHPAGSIAELFQAGWRIGERTLRPAMVAVSAGPVAPAPPPPPPGTVQ
jgi:molecular chaperone GrpE